MRLHGTGAVVTGAATGIGQAIAAGLARGGADVATIDLSDAEETKALVASTGREFFAVQGDTGDRGAVDGFADAVADRFGGIDIWVNNAARLLVKPVVETTDEEWHRLLAPNLHGYFYGCRAAARHMIEQGGGGRIVNLSSAADILAVGGLGAYTAAKGAIVALTKTLAVELAPHKITVNALAPGATDTPMNQRAYTAEVRRTYEARIPLGRIGSAEEVADAALFLASHESRYVTGQELVVDGGLTIDGTVGHARD